MVGVYSVFSVMSRAKGVLLGLCALQWVLHTLRVVGWIWLWYVVGVYSVFSIIRVGRRVSY